MAQHLCHKNAVVYTGKFEALEAQADHIVWLDKQSQVYVYFVVQPLCELGSHLSSVPWAMLR